MSENAIYYLRFGEKNQLFLYELLHEKIVVFFFPKLIDRY